jgi:DNA repair protein RadD
LSPDSFWHRLRKSTLQEELGDALLGRLEGLLPALLPDEATPSVDLYRTESLARLFEAFAAPAALRRKDFRATVFEACTEIELDSIISRLGGDPHSFNSFADKLQDLSTKPWRHSGLAPAMIEEFGWGEHLLPSPPQEVLDVQSVESPTGPLKRLKDYQFAVFQDIMGELEAPRARVILQMPTGSGKTRTAMEVISAYLESSPSTARRVVWLAHSSELCHQAADAFCEVWPHYATSPWDLYRSWGSSKGVPTQDAASSEWMWVTSLQTAYSLAKKDRLPEADLIVVDEAHKVLADTYNAATRRLMHDETRVVGLTATPGRSPVSSEENQALADFFFGRKVTIEADGENAIDFLRSRRVLSTLTREPLNTSATVKVGPTDTDVPDSVLAALGSNDLRSAEIVGRVAQVAQKGHSCLVFATSVDHSKFLTALLTYLEIRAAHIDGGTPKDERAHLINQFRNRELDVLCNFGVLTTGFDAPMIDVLCIARPTTSVVLYSQMLGRGLRGPAIGGTEHCRVIEVRDNIEGLPALEDLYNFFDEYYVA